MAPFQFLRIGRRSTGSIIPPAAFAAGILVAAVAGAAAAATVTINGVPVTPVYARSGHLLVPFRKPLEQIGAKVDWQKPTATATYGGEQLVTIHIAQTRALLKGHERQLSVAPELIGGLAYVPVEALADISNAKVEYSADRQTATVTNWDLAGINAIAAIAAGPVLDSHSNPVPYYYSGYPGPPTWFWILVFSSIVSAFVVFAADASVRKSERT